MAAFAISHRGRLQSHPPRIVSIGTGSNQASIQNGKLVHKPELMHGKRGRVMNDTCAITLARRGLIRYLLHEAEQFYKHQYETKMDEFDNIFRMDPEAHLLILRDGIDIILYLSGTV